MEVRMMVVEEVRVKVAVKVAGVVERHRRVR